MKLAGAARSNAATIMGIALGAVWTAVVPIAESWVGADLDVASKVERVDHTLPGLFAVAVLVALVLSRLDLRSGAAEAAFCLTALCGLWTTLTHLGLIGSADTTLGQVLFHSGGGWLLLAASARAWWLSARAAPVPP